MNLNAINFQIHKYKNGHQLVASTVSLDRGDQDCIDRLSDLSGQLRPGELFKPYLTCYPVPSEKYFVIARTWQDTNATRAGCVLTKSILVLLTDWVKFEDVSFIFRALLDSDIRVEYPVINERFIPTPSIQNVPIAEIVEALFLEQRKPIVIFDSEFKNEIVSRLYTAFWPSMRQKFTTCTFSLSPRSIKGRNFDLQFTKSDLKTRFSDQKLRRIDAGKLNKNDIRHRWTENLAAGIFLSDRPSVLSSLTDFDFLKDGDENALRINLLWGELWYKASNEAAPFALLGLLDILNSQSLMFTVQYQSVEPLIKKANREALLVLDSNDAWKFYGSLLSKHKRKLMGRDLLGQVKSSCTALTLKNPDAAITYLKGFNSVSTIPAVLFASIGDGLAMTELKSFDEVYYLLAPEKSLQLLATSKNFAKKTLRDISINSKENTLKNLISTLHALPGKSNQRALNNVLEYIDSPQHGELFQYSISLEKVEIFQKVIDTIIENKAINLQYFQDILFDSKANIPSFKYLYDKLSINHIKNKSIFSKIFIYSPELLEHFVSDMHYDLQFKSLTILDYFNKISLEEIANIPIGRDAMIQLFDFLILLKESSTEVLAQIALLVNLPQTQTLPIVATLDSKSLNNLNSKALALFLQNIVSENLNSPLTSEIVSKINNSLAQKLVTTQFLVSKHFSEETFMFFAMIPATKGILIKNVDNVSEILSSNLNESVKGETLELWMALVIASNDKFKRVKAAALILRYSFAQKQWDPSTLIAFSFPILYHSYAQGQSLSQKFSFWIFPDWDKCKILRQDLVNRYLNSTWSKANLLHVARKTKIFTEVVTILNQTKSGRKYLEEAIAEVKKSVPNRKKLGSKKIRRKLK